MSDSVYAPLLPYPSDKKEVLLSVNTPNGEESASRIINRSSESKSACLDSKDKLQSERSQRFKVLSFLQNQGIGTKSINRCFRSPIDSDDAIQIKHKRRKDFSRNSIGMVDFGVMTNVCQCYSGLCPVHSLDHAKKHRIHHRRIFKQCESTSKKLHYLVFTIAHNGNDSLHVLSRVVKRAVDELHKIKNKGKGEFWEKTFMNCIGFSKSLECTWGTKNGFHPHIQMLVASDTNEDDKDLQRLLVQQYKQILSRFHVVHVNKETGQEISDDVWQGLLEQEKSINDWSIRKQLKEDRQGFFPEVHMYTKKQSESGLKGPFTCTTEDGVYVRRVVDSAKDRDKISQYLSKGMMLDHHSKMVFEMTDGGTKQAIGEQSFTPYQLMLHASDVKRDMALEQYEKTLCWNPRVHWRRVINHYFWSLKGMQIFTYGGDFKMFAKKEFEGEEDSYSQKEDEKAEDVGSVTVDPKWINELKKTDAFHRSLWFHSDPSLSKIVKEIVSMIPAMKLSDLKIDNYRNGQEVSTSDLVMNLPSQGVEIESVKAYDLLLEKTVRPDVRSDRWVSVDDWEKLLISFGVVIKSSSGITNVSTYKRYANGFHFKVIQGVRMMKLKNDLLNSLMNPQKVTLAA